MVLRLAIIEGPDRGRSFTVPSDEPQLIGRSSEALPITDTTVSRRHAELTPDEGKWFIRDLKSQNHTYVNGGKLTGRTELHVGDEIRVGSTVFKVGDPEDDAGKAVEMLGDDRLDSEIEHSIASNEDSIVLAEPEPSRAALEHLRVIYRLTTITSRIVDRRELLAGVMDLVFSVFDPERGVIMLVVEGEDPTKNFLPEDAIELPEKGDVPLVGIGLRPAVVKYREPPEDDEVEGGGEGGGEKEKSSEEEEKEKIQVSRTIIQRCVRDGQGILSSNAQADPRFQAGDSVARFNIRSAICSPIMFQDRAFGAIYIDSSIANYTFTPEQLALMNAIGLHTALAMANAEQTARRIHAERLAAIGETVASLSHSIKNILQGLRGGAEVLEMGLTKDDPKIARGGWDILKRNLDRIVQLTMNMLTFSRQRHLEIELTKLDVLAEECRQLHEKTADAKGVALIVDAEPDAPPIPVDPSLMHQAIMNLVSNAIDAAPAETGVVTIRVRMLEPGPAHPTLRGPAAEIIVSDNGPGIPKERLGWIFEPFNTTKGLRGTGLGLAVTRRIIQDHRGRIRVETAEGRGTTLRVRIPADLGAHTDPSATTERRAPAKDLLGRL